MLEKIDKISIETDIQRYKLQITIVRDKSRAIDRHCVEPTTELAQKSYESRLVVLYTVAGVVMSP